MVDLLASHLRRQKINSSATPWDSFQPSIDKAVGNERKIESFNFM